MIQASRYPLNLADAQERYAKCSAIDPFPDIPPALLNSADICDYVAATGMIFPFVEDADHLKPASYELPIEGLYVYWDGAGGMRRDFLKPGEPFILKANTITFVTLGPLIQLPEYIAVRFNLRITHIYRGILLGTGPLVDPGFVGRLSMPLHNLTTNDYELRGGEGLIWMEITKVSPLRGRPSLPLRERPSRQGTFVPLPASKKGDLDINSYLFKAEPHGKPIRSSIPEVVEVAKREAEEATDAAKHSSVSAYDAAKSAAQSVDESERTRRVIEVGLLFALVVGTISAVGVVASIYSLVQGANGRIDALRAEFLTAQAGHEPPVTSTVQSIASVAQRLNTYRTWGLSALLAAFLLILITMGFTVWRTRKTGLRAVAPQVPQPGGPQPSP